LEAEFSEGDEVMLAEVQEGMGPVEEGSVGAQIAGAEGEVGGREVGQGTETRRESEVATSDRCRGRRRRRGNKELGEA
jgi:hypothetical protein